MNKSLTPMQRSLNLWAIILIIWSVYRTKLQLPEWFDEFIAKPIVFLLPVIWYIKKYEQKPFFKSVYLAKENLFKNIKVVFFIGLLLTGSALLANYFNQSGVNIFQNFFTFTPTKLGLIIAISLATAISEEILSRGFILKRLYEDSKNIYSASFLSSVLFLILHVPILFTTPNIQGNLILLILTTDFILGMVNSFLAIEGKNLVSPILVHALYNLAIILYI